MGTIQNQSIKSSFTIFFSIQVFFLLILGILLVALYRNQHNLAASRDLSFNSYLLADELRQSSDDLTYMVRAYVATGNPEFEKYYWTILGIRNGEIPRPLDYNRSYWDFVVATGQKPRADGEKVSLRELMIRVGFTPIELEKLNLAQKNSDGLVKAETVAFNAMKGLFDDGTGHFTIKKEPDPVLAGQLVNGPEYYRTKAEIMKPIDDFFQMFQERTGASVKNYLRLANILFWLGIPFAIFVLLISIYGSVFIRRQLSAREKAEKEIIDLQQNLEKRVNDRTTELQNSQNELKKFLSESERINKLLVGRELQMIELKKQLKELGGEYLK